MVMLRSFDYQVKYGPSYGLTRMQRWKRAEKLGLFPPLTIFEILDSMDSEMDKPRTIFDDLH